MSAGSDSVTPGTLVAFTALQVRLFGPARDLLDAWIQVQGSSALFERVFNYLDLPHDIVDSPRAQVLLTEHVRGFLALHNVSFSYESPGSGIKSVSPRGWALED